MNSRPIQLVLGFMALFCRLAAGEWSGWDAIGDLIEDRTAVVTARSKREEGGDDMAKGYLCTYELHNGSGTLTAKVALYLPQQHRATGAWMEIDRTQPPTVVHELPPQGTVSGSRYSPSPRGMRYEADVTWSENLPPGGKPAKPAASDDDEQAKDKPTADSGQFEGISVANNAALLDALRATPDEARFRLKIIFKAWSGERPFYTDSVDSEGALIYHDYPWSQWLGAILAKARGPGVHHQAVFKVLSSTPSAMTVEFSDVSWHWVANFLYVDEGPANQVLAMERLAPPGQSAPAPQPKKIIPPSKPATESAAGSFTVEAVSHQGYWFDPDYNDAKAADPVIFVRVSGQSKPTKLSAAKEAYGVPKDATIETMSHYSAQRVLLIIDRGTHQP